MYTKDWSQWVFSCYFRRGIFPSVRVSSVWCDHRWENTEGLRDGVFPLSISRKFQIFVFFLISWFVPSREEVKDQRLWSLAVDELVYLQHTALTAECPRSLSDFSGQLAHETILCWWEDAHFIADMLSVVLRLECRRSGFHTHINTEESHLVPLTCQLEAAKQMALMREAGIIQYSTLLTFTCGAARQPLIQPSLDYSHTAQRREERATEVGTEGC